MHARKQRERGSRHALRFRAAPSHRDIYNAIARGDLKVHRPEADAGGHNKIEIEPDDLFQFSEKKFPKNKIVKVTPGLPPVQVLALKFLILNWSRWDEVHFMVWPEWQREGDLWVIPWQRVKGRNKAGAKKIDIDHVVPLNHRSIEILNQLEEQQKRDDNNTPFVFANYRCANGSVRMGSPISEGAVTKLLKRLLPPEEIKAMLHGMRTTGRSWGNVQRRLGLLNVVEDDLERALAHVEGYGKKPLNRLYSRDDDETVPLISIFDAWADYCNCMTAPAADLIPIRRQIRKG